MTLVIGLTGSIASGKSTVARMFQDLDIPVVDADQISREVVEPGETAYQEIVETFGKEVLHDDGSLNRKKLGAIVFQDENKRQMLNAIVHPQVRKKMLERRDTYVAEQKKAVVLDIPLLFESKLTHFVEKTVVVYVDPEVQLERLMNRDNLTEDEALQRMNAQIPITEKAKMADAVIDNNGSIEESYKQLKQILEEWHVL
ncbi:MAG: dephospho-CoA kinase [Bacillaceae bacterium]|nr:dephospho-CoA kinase [Bacillaceae bacterium]